MHASYKKLSKELTNGIENFSRPSGFKNMDQYSQNNGVINNSRTA